MRTKKKQFPEWVESIKRKCFVCDKIHFTCGGSSVRKMVVLDDKKIKKTYIVSRHAPLGCWLAHNKKEVDNFYKNKELVRMWKND